MSDEKPGHSPGPWQWSDLALVDANGDAVAIAGNDDSVWVPIPADARLIAAAPEMAELLREFVAAWDSFVRENATGAGDGIVQEDPLAVKARALLARLDG